MDFYGRQRPLLTKYPNVAYLASIILRYNYAGITLVLRQRHSMPYKQNRCFQNASS